jgi:hypothetical protein
MAVVFESYHYFKNDAVRSRICQRLRSPESIPWNWFLGSLYVYQFGLRNHLMDVGRETLQ